MLLGVHILPNHTDSVPIYARYAEDHEELMTDRARELKAREEVVATSTHAYNRFFAGQDYGTKRRVLKFLIGAKQKGKPSSGPPSRGRKTLSSTTSASEGTSWTTLLIEIPTRKLGSCTKAHPDFPPRHHSRGKAGLHSYPALESYE